MVRYARNINSLIKGLGKAVIHKRYPDLRTMWGGVYPFCVVKDPENK
jgi:hypothetical protein